MSPTRKYTTTKTVSSPDNYKIAPGEPLSTVSGDVDSHFNANLYDIDDRLYDIEEKLEGVSDYATPDMSALDIRTELNNSTDGVAINAGTLEDATLAEVRGKVMPPRLKRMIQGPDSIGLASELSSSRGAYHFDGRYIYVGSGKNMLKFDPRAGDMTPTTVTVTGAPAAADYEIVAITSDGTYLYLIYDKSSGTENYHFVTWNPTTSSLVATKEITYNANIGRLHFAFWWRSREDTPAHKLLIIGETAYFVYDITDETATLNKPTTAVSDPVAAVMGGYNGLQFGASKTALEMWVLWQTNGDTAANRMQRVILDEDGLVFEEYALYLGEVWPSTVYDMVITPQGGLWVTAFRTTSFYLMLFHTDQLGGDPEVTEYWEIGSTGSAPYPIPRMIDSDGTNLYLHATLTGFTPSPPYNSQAYTGITGYIRWASTSIGDPGSIVGNLGYYPGKVYSFGPDFFSADVASMDYEIVGKEFDGGHYWIFIQTTGSSIGGDYPQCFAIRSPEAGPNGMG